MKFRSKNPFRLLERHAHVHTDQEYNSDMTEDDEDETCFFAGQNFVPTPWQGKKTTLNKKQKKMLKHGVDLVNEQDTAMWSALSGRSSFCEIVVSDCDSCQRIHASSWADCARHTARNRSAELHAGDDHKA